MQVRKQFTVFLENKPGRLASVLSGLAEAKVNIVALSVMDRSEHGVLRVVVDDEAAAASAMQAMNAPFSPSEVLAIELRNHPGALAHVCETLAAGHINIDYAYCSSGGRNGRVFGIFRVSNPDKAQRVLDEAGNHRRSERRTLRNQRAYRRV